MFVSRVNQLSRACKALSYHNHTCSTVNYGYRGCMSSIYKYLLMRRRVTYKSYAQQTTFEFIYIFFLLTLFRTPLLYDSYHVQNKKYYFTYLSYLYFFYSLLVACYYGYFLFLCFHLSLFSLLIVMKNKKILYYSLLNMLLIVRVLGFIN